MVIVVGTGKLASELLNVLPRLTSIPVVAWADAARTENGPIVVHAGSGRELEAVIGYCQQTGATLVELATGSALESREVSFPVVICPNTNILMLKFMAMLAASGHMFKNETVRVIESHQADKSSVPGTAVAVAQSLDLPSDQIVSIRDPQEQVQALHIPAEHLARHAYHRVEIENPACRITFETRVFGAAPYAQGVAQIIAAVQGHPLESRRYSVMEFIEKGWV